MAHLSRKLVKEIKLSRRCINIIAEGLLDFKGIRDTVLTKIYKATESDIMDFIGEYDGYISKVCNNRKYYLKDESRDCEQFIKMYLCKVYHKRHKYSNFGKVVHAIIKRKAIDFSKARNQDLKGMINETDYLAESESVNSFIEQHSKSSAGDYSADMTASIIDDSLKIETEDFSRDTFDIKKIVNELFETIVSIEQFTPRDLQVMGIIKKCVDAEHCDMNYIFSKISDNKTKASQEFNFLIKRIAKYIDETKYL